MQTTSCAGRVSARLAIITIVMSASARCGIEKQAAPALAGPSEFGTSITLIANPDTLPRDGVSQSQIVVSVRDSQGNLLRDRMRITLLANAGTLSAREVEIVNGLAWVTFTAPSLQEVVRTAVISAVPVGTNIDNAAFRSVAIALLAPAAANPSFVVTPASPARYAVAVLDASGTTLNGAPCGPSCTYVWNLGGEATAIGQVISYRFRQEGAYTVTLSVTSPGDIITTRQQNITVGSATMPAPDFTFSPTDARVGETLFFNATASKAANGATIVDYLWDFGNGSTASGATVNTSFPAARTYRVLLTVRDSNGLVGSLSRDVSIKEP